MGLEGGFPKGGVCVDEKRTLVEQGCGVAAQAGDSSIGQGGIHFII